MLVDVSSPDLFDQLRESDAFLWRGFSTGNFETMRRLIPAVESGLGIPTFPSTRQVRLTHDKIAQSFLFQAHSIPYPETRVFFNFEEAIAYSQTINLPTVIKFMGGAHSEGVGIVRNRVEALHYVQSMFGTGLDTIVELEESSLRLAIRRVKQSLKDTIATPSVRPARQQGYAMFQEFLPNNEGDFRITVIGSCAIGFRRQNRPGDFRASGSGLIDSDPDCIPESVIRLAFDVSEKLSLPFTAVDIIFRNQEPVICELNFAYRAPVVDSCPGYWRRCTTEGENPFQLQWVSAPVNCAEITISEFLRTLPL